MPNLLKSNLDPDVLSRAKKAADRLRPSAAATRRKAAMAATVADPQDVQALIELVDALSEPAAPACKNLVDDELTPNEAAEILGMSRPSVMRLIAKGELHPRMVLSRHKLSRAEVMSLALTQTRQRRAAIANLAALSEEFDF